MDKVLLLTCAAHAGEAASALGACGHADVVVGAFPDRCGRPPLTGEEVSALAAGHPECSLVLLAGGPCLPAEPLDLPGKAISRLALSNCFHLYLNKSLVDNLTGEGALLITPDRLSRWREWLGALGFNPDGDTALAREFFAETASSITLLDTTGLPTSLEELARFGAFLGRPVAALPVGQDHLSSLLGAEIASLALAAERDEKARTLKPLRQKLSNHAVLLDLMGRLNRADSEAEAIEEVLNLFSSLFAPEKLSYARFENGKPHPETPPTEISGTESGFKTSLLHDGELYGEVWAYGFSLAEKAGQYQSFAEEIAPIVALSVANARNRERMDKAEATLRKMNTGLESMVEERTLKLKEINAALTSEVEERKTAQATLAESEEMFRQLAEHISEVFWIRDNPGGPPTYISPAFDEVWGVSRIPVLTGERAWSDFIHAEDKARLENDFKGLLEGGPMKALYRVVRPDGSERWIEDEAYPVSRATNQKKRVVGIAKDVTDQRKALDLREQLAHAQKMEAIGTLAGGIAHDFNNILGAILGYTELTLLDDGWTKDTEENLREILAAGRRAKELVKQILAYSRKTEEERPAIDIAPVVSEALSMLSRTLPSSTIIKSDIESKGLHLKADPTQIYQIVMNLCTNAYQAMKGVGEILVTVKPVYLNEELASKINALNPGEYLCLTVKDTGPGIEPHILNRIFDPFFTTKPVGQGTGMGLPVVHGIVKSHLGTLTVESPFGEGALFKIYLPVMDKPAKAQKADPAQRAIPRGRGQRLLVVDDEVAISKMYKKMLTSLGYEPVVTTSPEKALELFRDDPLGFDGLLTDQTMPLLTGDQLVRLVREIRPGFKIVMLSGYSEKIDKDSAAELGVSAFLMKPVDKAELAQALEKVLNG